MKVTLITIVITIFSLTVSGQNIQYARNIIDTLCSPYFAGRGYQENGANKAAIFIENEFRYAGLQSISDTYKQDFSISVNHITQTQLQKGKLVPGKDYVVSVLSGGASGTYKVKKIQEELLTNKLLLRNFLEADHSNNMILFPPEIYEHKDFSDIIRSIVYGFRLKTAGIILGVSTQPVWSVHLFQKPFDYPIITMKMSNRQAKKLKKIRIEIETEYIDNYPVSNVIAMVEGTQYPDSFFVISAHYDHLGKMGDVMYPGAHDNASGVAMMLDMAHYYVLNPQAYTMVFLATTAEEAGILGAYHFVENTWIDLAKIKFLINLDLVGTGKEGIQVVNGSVYEKEFQLLNTINAPNNLLSEIEVRGESCNSDHCPFYEQGVPSFFIYTLDKDYPWYHVPEDSPKKLPLTAYENLFTLIVNFFDQLCH
jgi:aminopeptidase YwaD